MRASKKYCGELSPYKESSDMLLYRAFKWTIQDHITQVVIMMIIIIIFNTSNAHFNISIWSNAHAQK